MNKRKEMDVKIVRAKINAQKAVKKYIENWYAEEPEEVKSAINRVSGERITSIRDGETSP